MTLDRKLPPLSTKIEELKYTKPQSTLFDNGNSLHCIIKEEANIAKIEIQYDAGYIYQSKSLLAACTNAMLLEGSNQMDSKEIAEYFDGEGAFLEYSCSAEKASITLYCLKRNLRKTASKLLKIIDNANFEQREIDNYLKIQKQKFIVDNEKMSFKARNNFLNILVGQENSYTNNIALEDFDNVSRDDLINFYRNYYLKGVKQVFISGGIDEKDLTIFKRYLDGSSIENKVNLSVNLEIIPSPQNQLVLKNETAIQTAIRMGCVTFGRKDARFPQLFMLNTILGGYFGSRLMKNIREDKGYTYGIGSGIINYRELSYLIIVTEVGVEYTNQTLEEIRKEIDRLKREAIKEEELNLVKNYILGNLLRGFDGAYEAMDRFKGLLNFGLNYDYYKNFVREIEEANSFSLSCLAREVFLEGKMKKILAGNI